jgi:uncharacterized membrane protein HdeD (DUF308 family)
VSALPDLNIRFRIAGLFIIVIGIVIYFWRGLEIVLVLPVLGAILVIAGFAWKPKKKIESTGD